MQIKMTENTWLMSKLYKMGCTYEVSEDIHYYLKDKSELVEMLKKSKTTNKKKLSSTKTKK